MGLNIQQEFLKSRILVIGDIMLDHYVIGSVSRISPEAPVPVLLKESEHYYLGGAGNVFSNVHTLGGQSDILSVIGDDDSGDIVIDMVNSKSDLSNLLKSASRKTTCKSRYIGNSHQLLRVDDETCDNIDIATANSFIEKFRSIIDLYDCVIIEDYNKGLLTPDVIKQSISIAKSRNKIIIVDPKIKNIGYYSGSTYIKPNFSEFCSMVDEKLDISDISHIVNKAREVLIAMSIDGILITLSDKGILYVDSATYYHSPGYPINVSDVSGAGDTVTAMFALATCSGIGIENTLTLCNISGSIACSQIGAVSVNISDVIKNQYFKF
jgi:rfaE bifunctional protein kinase chain/domain